MHYNEMLDTISMSVLCRPHSPTTPHPLRSHMAGGGNHGAGVMKTANVTIPGTEDQVEQVTTPVAGHAPTIPDQPSSYTTYPYHQYPPYLQVIQLVEVPAPPPRSRDAWESRYSSSYATSSSSGTSSRSSFVDSCYSSEEEDDGVGGKYEGEGDEMDTRPDEEGESIDGTAGVLDEECDRIRLERVSAWLSDVEVDWDHIYDISEETSASSLRRRLATNYVCSACDHEFVDRGALRAHGYSQVGGDGEGGCMGAVVYALDDMPPARSPTALHTGTDNVAPDDR